MADNQSTTPPLSKRQQLLALQAEMVSGELQAMQEFISFMHQPATQAFYEKLSAIREDAVPDGLFDKTLGTMLRSSIASVEITSKLLENAAQQAAAQASAQLPSIDLDSPVLETPQA